MKEKKQETEEREAPIFQPEGLSLLGANVWAYRHKGEMPESVPNEFWQEARRNFGMKDNACVILIENKKAALVVVQHGFDG